MIKPQISKAIDLFLEQYYEQSEMAGNHLFGCFPGTGGKNQVRNLQNAAYTATRFSSIQNFIKNQMGKDTKKNPTWTKKLTEGASMGDFLLKQLEKLAQESIKLAKIDLTEDPLTGSLEIRLCLARGWAQQVASHYLYLVALRS